MNLPQITKSYSVLLILLFGWTMLLAQAQPGSVVDLPDSARLSIRLKAHLLINPEKITTHQLDSLQQQDIPLALLVSPQSAMKLNQWVSRISKENHPVPVVYPDGLPNGSENDAGVISLSGDETDKIQFPADPETFQNEHSLNEFLWFTVTPDSLPSFDYFLRFWERTGKLPNFIQVDAGNMAEMANVVTALNNQPKIFGVVRNGSQLLAGVSWKDLPDRKTSGYFSFPVLPFVNQALAPYKPGYRFSPDIILPSPENLLNLKVFNAVPLDPDFGLTDHFTFSKRVRNLKRKNDPEIINYGIEFAGDKNRGNSAYFSGKAYMDGGLKSGSALKSNFSLTAWIKPTQLNHNNCILGKGKEFVLKIHNGLLTFTVQGVKDYFSVKTPVPPDQWSFIGLVHNGSDHYISFYLNGELTEKIRLLTPYSASDYTMLIGSNLWEEFFIGYLSEIKIWERELNDEEIRNEFRKGAEAGFLLSRGWLIGIFLFLGTLGFGFGRWLLHQKTGKRTTQKVKTPELKTPELRQPKAFQEQINCFGGLSVMNAEGKDLSLKFSPKIKQLFVLIFLHSVGGRNGISSKKLSDCLWPGMNQQNAKNIRGTNIQNLKALLASCSGIKLVFRDKLWLLEFSPGYFADYAFVETTLNSLNTGTAIDEFSGQLADLVGILKRGPLFPNIRESWIDPHIERMSNRIIEFGLKLFRDLQEEKYDSLLLDVAEVVGINDPLNEPALRKKISILTRQGKLSLAHSVFDNFTKLHFELYQEKYPGDFKSMVAGENSEWVQ